MANKGCRDVVKEVREILADDSVCADRDAMVDKICDAVGQVVCDGVMDEATQKLDKVISEAVMEALTKNGYRWDADGDAGEIFIHDDEAKKTFVLDAVQVLAEYEKP